MDTILFSPLGKCSYTHWIIFTLSSRVVFLSQLCQAVILCLNLLNHNLSRITTFLSRLCSSSLCVSFNGWVISSTSKLFNTSCTISVFDVYKLQSYSCLLLYTFTPLYFSLARESNLSYLKWKLRGIFTILSRVSKYL